MLDTDSDGVGSKVLDDDAGDSVGPTVVRDNNVDGVGSEVVRGADGDGVGSVGNIGGIVGTFAVGVIDIDCAPTSTPHQPKSLSRRFWAPS